MTRFEKTAITAEPTDLSGILAGLNRLQASVDAIDPCLDVDGQRVTRALIGHTDAALGARAASAERGRLA